MMEKADIYLLCLDTSEHQCLVSLLKNGIVLAEQLTECKQGHSQHVHIFIDHVVRSVGLLPSDLHGIAWISGPGSYTGLRIASSAAKGLCIALSLPMITVSSTLALAIPFFDKGFDSIVSMIDARRMEAYVQLFDGEGAPKSTIKPQILDQTFAKNISKNKNKVLCVGSGADKWVDIKHFAPNIQVHTNVQVQFSKIGVFIQAMYKEEKFSDPYTFEPLYAKEVSIHGVPGAPKPV